MIFYAENITPRLKYIADFIFTDILGLELEYINDLELILDTKDHIINYSYDTFDNSFRIVPHSLLDQHIIHEQQIEISKWEDLPIFFQCNENCDVPFDILAASFYLISRYEEYLPHTKDEHGRFEYTESIAHKHGFLKRPLVDEWVLLLGKKLKNKWPELQLKKRTFKHLSTIDVDIAWAFKNRPFYRILGASVRDLINFDFKNFSLRCKVLFGLTPDPYFTFPYIKEVHEKAGLRPTFFIQIGKHGKFDKNISLKNKKFRKFLKELSTWADIGLHPSYASHDDINKLEKEIQSFKEFLGVGKIKSRQHFLRVTIPDTYQALCDFGVSEEYSMGYAGNTGFRAGTCTPHLFFNLKNNEATNMQIMPFQVMENSMKKYLKYTPDQGRKEIYELRERVRKVNGIFVTLWHNQSVNDYLDWKGWRTIFEGMFEDR